jgi:hypothetical protein
VTPPEQALPEVDEKLLSEALELLGPFDESPDCPTLSREGARIALLQSVGLYRLLSNSRWTAPSIRNDISNVAKATSRLNEALDALDSLTRAVIVAGGNGTVGVQRELLAPSPLPSPAFMNELNALNGLAAERAENLKQQQKGGRQTFLAQHLGSPQLWAVWSGRALIAACGSPDEKPLSKRVLQAAEMIQSVAEGHTWGDGTKFLRYAQRMKGMIEKDSASFERDWQNLLLTDARARFGPKHLQVARLEDRISLLRNPVDEISHFGQQASPGWREDLWLMDQGQNKTTL